MLVSNTKKQHPCETHGLDDCAPLQVTSDFEDKAYKKKEAKQQNRGTRTGASNGGWQRKSNASAFQDFCEVRHPFGKV